MSVLCVWRVAKVLYRRNERLGGRDGRRQAMRARPCPESDELLSVCPFLFSRRLPLAIAAAAKGQGLAMDMVS